MSGAEPEGDVSPIDLNQIEAIDFTVPEVPTKK